MVMFFILNLANVIFSTLKSLFLARTDNKIINAMTQAGYYGFYTLILKSIMSVSALQAVTVCIIANLIGTVIAMIICDKLIQKPQLFKISITLLPEKSVAVLKDIEKRGLAYKRNTVQYKDKKYIDLSVYCYGEKEMTILKAILKSFGIRKYTIDDIKVM